MSADPSSEDLSFAGGDAKETMLRQRQRDLGSCVTLLFGLMVLAGGGAAIWFLATRERQPVPKPEPKEIAVQNGESRIFDAATQFTFWKTVVPSDIQPDPKAEFATLSPEQERTLLESAVIKAPQGLIVSALGVGLATEPAEVEFQVGQRLKQTFRVKHTRYVLSGQWNVEVPADFPEGEHAVTIDFPAIGELKKQLGANHPNHAVAVGFTFRTRKAAENDGK